MLDNSCQNTVASKGQIDGLIFTLFTAISMMSDTVGRRLGVLFAQLTGREVRYFHEFEELYDV